MTCAGVMNSPYTPGRHVLMVACGFPPTGGAGVQRSAKFAKYLPRFGWLPAVWTADPIGGLPQDPTLLADMPPEVTVHRWAEGGGVRTVRRLFQGGLGRGRIMSKLTEAAKWRFEGWLAGRSCPDKYASWARTSVRPLVRLIGERSVDVIYSTFSPASNHLLALALKTEAGLPWVADFRDLWTDDPRYEERCVRRRAAHRLLEQRILEAADVVAGVSPRQTEILADHVPDERHKFITISNGFDPADFADVDGERHRAADVFTLAFVGRLDRYRANDALLAGLRRFVVGLKDDRDRFVFRIIGHADESTLARIASAGIPHVFAGYVPHKEAIREMASADALLASVKPSGPHIDSIINGKIFEYLASRRPILVVGPRDGECQKVVRSCGAGLSAEANEESVANALSRLYDAWRTGRPLRGCDAASLQQYSRLEQTGQLAAVLDFLTGRRSAEDAASGLTGSSQPFVSSPSRGLEPARTSAQAEACGSGSRQTAGTP